MDPSQQPQPQWQQQPQQPVQPLQPAPTPPQTSQPIAVSKDPNSTLGIVGLVLAFFIGPAGVVVSIIALIKSKKVGFKNTPALIGIILGLVMTVVSILVMTIAFSSVNNTINDFKKDCDAKNGTVINSSGGNYRCEYKIYQ